MANYLITGSRNNTPHITSMDDASFNAGILGNGAYILKRGENLRAEMTTANNCRIYDGDIVTQGRHSRIETSSYIDLTVSNGTVGMKRNDLVVARYESDVETGIESVDFIVIQGTPSANPTDPEYNEGNIFDGDLIVDFPLYRIRLDGITAGTPELICDTTASIDEVADYIIECGKSGIWDWEKWASGKATCSGIRSFSSLVDSITQRGAVYYVGITSYSFPSGLFTAAPELNITFRNDKGAWFAADEAISASETGGGRIYTPVSQPDIQAEFHYSAIGKWK